MSRSFRKHPFFNGNNSNRWGKQHSARLLRHHTKQILNKIDDEDEYLIPLADELYDFWWDNDSGCHFNIEEYPYLLRK